MVLLNSRLCVFLWWPFWDFPSFFYAQYTLSLVSADIVAAFACRSRQWTWRRDDDYSATHCGRWIEGMTSMQRQERYDEWRSDNKIQVLKWWWCLTRTARRVRLEKVGMRLLYVDIHVTTTVWRQPDNKGVMTTTAGERWHNHEKLMSTCL